MTLNQKNKLIKKYGSKTINQIFIKFIKGKTVTQICEEYGWFEKDICDILRVSFYTLDAIIVDQREEVEGMEILMRSALALLPDKTRKELIEKAKQKKDVVK